MPSGRPDDYRQMGRFYYTKGKTSGHQQFSPFKFGDYEVRVYFDWPKGGYEVKERIAFVVGDC